MADLQSERWDALLDAAVRAGAGRPERIADFCVEMLAVTGAGVSLVSDTGNRQVVCGTDEVALRIEELQVTLGEGPCIDALNSGGPVLVPDLDDRRDLVPERWPAFLAGVVAEGVRAVFDFPLRIGAIKLGALDLYRDRPGPLRDGQLRGALLAAEAAGLTMLSSEEQEGKAAGLAPLSFSAQVHQATGMVMVQAAVSVEQAFLLLRAHAFATSSSLDAVAADVVGGGLRFDTEDS